MIPDVSEVLEEWATPVTHNRYEITSVNFVETLTKTLDVTIQAVVQPASPDMLQSLQVDFSLRHVQIHSDVEILFGDYIVDNGMTYKVITPSDYQRYGYTEVVGEEVKGEIT